MEGVNAAAAAAIDSGSLKPKSGKFIELIGWIGVCTYAGAYFAYSHGMLREGHSYVLANTAAACCVALLSFKQRSVQNFVIQIVWIAIGLSALLLPM